MVSAAAIVAYAVAIATYGLPERLTWIAALLVVAFIAGLRRPQAVGSVQVSVSGVVQIAAIPLVGPVGAGLVAAFPVFLDRREPVKDVFNAAQRLLLVLAGALVYELVDGEYLSPGEAIDPLGLAAQMGAATLAAALTNAILLAGVLQLSSAGSLRTITRDMLRQVIPDYLSYVIAGYLLTILWAPARMEWSAALFVLPSLFVIQWGLQQYAVEWATRHQILAPFVRALDTRHPGAAEESRLVSDAAAAIATGLSLPAPAVDEVATAARIRHVGMLALDGAPPAIMHRDHAAAARRVVGSVDFLSGPLELVAAHHERVDGEGGPDGLRGAEIPLGSRIVAVADAWGTAVAGGRSRVAAVRYCEDLAGSALDKACVAALRRAWERDLLPEVADS